MTNMKEFTLAWLAALQTPRSSTPGRAGEPPISQPKKQVQQRRNLPRLEAQKALVEVQVEV